MTIRLESGQLGASCGGALTANFHEHAVASVLLRLRRNFPRNRYDADAVFSRAFGDQLLNPQAEGLELGRKKQCQLVAPLPGGGTEEESQSDSRIVHRPRRIAACLRPGCRK